MLNLVIKADVAGAAQALAGALHDQLSGAVHVIGHGTGAIGDDDVRRAAEAGAMVIGFHVRPTPSAQAAAGEVEIRLYDTFQEAVADIRSHLDGTTPLPRQWTGLGKAEVRRMMRKGLDTVAICEVTVGSLERRGVLRVFRDGVQVYEGKAARLRRLGREVHSVNEGQDCELAFGFYNELQAGDVLECVASRP